MSGIAVKVVPRVKDRDKMICKEKIDRKDQRAVNRTLERHKTQAFTIVMDVKFD